MLRRLRHHPRRRWRGAGDGGRGDDDGFVYVGGSAKGMIVVGGYKVFSSEVEDKLFKHPAIAMCALIGLPNPDRPDSEIVKLFVQKAEGWQDKPDGELESDIIAYARERLSPYKVPKTIEFVDSIPLTSVGKIDKKNLRPPSS